MGGGNVCPLPSSSPSSPVSPHGRGKREQTFLPFFQPPCIPAWAGETRQSTHLCRTRALYPRMGGGNMSTSSLIETVRPVSPHGRGKRRRRMLTPSSPTCIPAWAGETSCRQPAAGSGGLYPRMGGGNWCGGGMTAHTRPVSPHGRGKRRSPQANHPQAACIPAWAGETFPVSAAVFLVGLYPRMGGGNS